MNMNYFGHTEQCDTHLRSQEPLKQTQISGFAVSSFAILCMKSEQPVRLTSGVTSVVAMFEP